MASQEDEGRAIARMDQLTKLKTLFAEHAPLGWVVIQDRQLVLINQAFAAMLGHDRDELLSRDRRQAVSLVHPLDWNLFLQAMQMEAPGKGLSPPFQLRLVAADGQLVWVEAACHGIEYQGRPAWQIFVSNITPRKEAEDNLQWELRVNAAVARISRSLLAELVEVDALAAMVLAEARALTSSADGFISSLEAGTGYHRARAITPLMKKRAGTEEDPTLGPANPGQPQDGYNGLWGHALNTRQGFFTNHPSEHPNSQGLPQGHGLLSNFLAAPVIFGDKLIGQIALANSSRDYGPRDLATVEQLADLLALALDRIRSDQEKVSMTRQLQQSHKMEALGTLAGGIAHDFNNILAAIMGFAELATDQLPENHLAHTDLTQIVKAGVRAKELVRQILTFTRRTETRVQPLDVNRQVSDAVSMLSRTIPKMVNIQLRLAPSLPPVKGNGHQLEQVLLNLGSNAADAMPRGGIIVIETQKVWIDRKPCRLCGQFIQGDYVQLRFTDTGSGMSPEVMDKMFDPFFTTKGVGHGTGLGLSTVFGIVTSHGGHLDCTSRLGEGTSFCILLPLFQDAMAPMQGELGLGQAWARERERILVVDDEQTLREVVERVLTNQGYQVLEAGSGEEALTILRREAGSIHAVVMDLGMPGMGGAQCLTEMVRLDPKIRILVASGYLEYEKDDRLEKMGAAGFLAKPVSRKALLNKLREVLDQ